MAEPLEFRLNLKLYFLQKITSSMEKKEKEKMQVKSTSFLQ